MNPPERGATSPSDASATPQPTPAAPTDNRDHARLPFPVVGIGASAGGIGALNAFFRGLPASPGMAFVVVQHLPPERESLMADILARHTPMPVRQIEEGVPVEINHVYVIRPGFTVTLKQGVFHLGEPVEKRGHRRPVDDFFRSLAQEQQERAVAVVLSGMGTNGTAGAQAIKAGGGICLAQVPETAEFAGMPSSVIHAGYADQILEPSEMAAALLRYVQQPYVAPDNKRASHAQEAVQHESSALTDIFATLRTRTGHDFSGYKKPTVLRRIQRRMGLAGLQALGDYAARVREDQAETGALANDLMINVTGFFRDSESWEAFREAVVRPLVAGWHEPAPIRAWVTACASGEEAYTLAMLLAEEIERAGKRIEVKIFATDTADKALGLARAGVYPAGIEGDLSLERLDRFFEKEEHTYRIRRDVREMVVFAPHDLLRDPPFSRVDLCTCRNLLIYLEPEVQERVLTLMHFSLKERGHLFLGTAETLGASKDVFETISQKHRIYRKTGSSAHRYAQLPMFVSRALPDVPRAELAPNLTRSATVFVLQQALFECFGPPTVIVDREDRIVYFHGNTTSFFEQPLGEPTRHLFEVLNLALRTGVRTALRRATAENKATSLEAVTIEGARGPLQVEVTVAPLLPAREAEYFRISFETLDDPEVTTARAARLRRKTRPSTRLQLLQAGPDPVLEDELRLARRELQNSLEAYEASNEELKASNEEVVSINEELQSANEELETSKEELQSLNEELITVNGQLQVKVAELEASNNDLSNLWTSTNLAVVFLDLQFRVRRFTPAINDLLALMPADIGRPIDHLAPKFTDGNLLEEARAVLAKLIPAESEVRSHSGVWYLRRTLPYRTAEHRIEGIVITFVDITARKHAEQALEAAQARLQAVIEQMPAALLMVEAPSGKLLYGNRRAAALFGHPYPLPFIGSDWHAAAVAFKAFHADGRTYESQEWPLARTLTSKSTITDEELEFARPEGGRGTLSMSAAPIHNQDGGALAAVATFWDISERKRTERALRESEERFRLLLESAIDYAIIMLDADGRISHWNSGAERLLGWSEREAVGRPVAMLFTPEDRTLGVPDQELHTALTEGRARDERTHQRKDGTRFWASGTLTSVHDSSGRVHGFAKIMRDHSELKQAQDQLHQALRASEQLRVQAETANRAKDDFISTVSHELRTPLNTIRLWSRILSSGKTSEEQTGTGAAAIDRAVSSQQALIDDLLDVSRMASGKLRLAVRDTSLAHAVRGAVEAIRPSANSRGLNLEARIDESVGIVRADPERLQQVVWNLLSNAVKFTPSGGQVVVELTRRDDRVEIAVRDSGIGIRPEFLPHVFERFRQAEVVTSRQHTGLGLGLAIARQLVELHGGSITAHSEGEGRGATFTVLLPLVERPDLDIGESHPEYTRADLEGLEGVDVLLVEDEGATGQAEQRLLEAAGAQVRATPSAAAAREAFARRRPDMIVCDIGLPGEDGYVLMRSLRALEREAHADPVPAVAVTAFARQEDRQRALAAGFTEHLAKPIDPAELIELLAGWARDARKTPS
jgi:two-component system CheB/CheR fusion protein